MTPCFTTRHTAASTACHTADGPIAWGEFCRRVHARRAEIAAAGHTRWLLADTDAADFAVNLLAVLAAGASAVVPPNLQPGTLGELSFAYDMIAPLEPVVPAQDHEGFRELPALPEAGVIDMYTSGSTGEPKCIRKTVRQFAYEVRTLEALWGARLGDRVVIATAPHTHFYGVLFRVWWPLIAGRPFDSTLASDPQAVQARLARWPGATLVSSPAQLSRMPELVDLADFGPRPGLVFSSGGPLPPAAAAAFHAAWGEAPTEVFGSTETGGIAWRRQEGDTAWTPMPGVTATADEDTALVVRSAWLESDAPWRMDDGVEFLADGRFRMRGRLDRTVKIEEKRVALPDVEHRLAAHPWVRQAAAVVLGAERQRIAVAVVLAAGAPAAATPEARRELAAALRSYLGHFFDAVVLPRHWRFPAELPYNERGKLTQADLAALFTRADAAGADSDDPREGDSQEPSRHAPLAP